MSHDAQGPAIHIAHHVGVSKQLFNYWLSTGKLSAVGEDEAGRQLYRLSDAVEVERATRASRRSSRNPARRLVNA